MRQVFKRDWEIVRIFLILATLTVVFVWGMQSLLLAPTATPHIQNFGASGSTPADTGPHQDQVVLGQLDIFVNVSNLPRVKSQSPLRRSADASEKK